MESNARRTLLALRLAVYGAAALLALGVYLVSAHQAAPAEPLYGVQLNGSTQQSMPAYVVMHGGEVRRLRLEWKRFTCSDGARFSGPAGGTFNDAVDDFHARGRAFSVAVNWAYHGGGGGIDRFHLEASGRLAADGRSATGQTRAIVTLVRDARVRATCSSGPFGWHVARTG